MRETTDPMLAEPTQKYSLFSFKGLLYGILCPPTFFYLLIQKLNLVLGKDLV